MQKYLKWNFLKGTKDLVSPLLVMLVNMRMKVGVVILYEVSLTAL